MAPIDPITLRIPEIKTYHKHPYKSISPLRPELSQKGKTVLITGASSGIGFAIARGFVQAKARRVILLGRREGVVKAAAEKLGAEVEKGDLKEVGTEVVPLVCDISDLGETEKLWEGLKREGVVVDVLVLNAAVTGKIGSVLGNGFSEVWGAFEVNVRSVLDWTARFYNQEQGEGRQKVCAFLFLFSIFLSFSLSLFLPSRFDPPSFISHLGFNSLALSRSPLHHPFSRSLFITLFLSLSLISLPFSSLHFLSFISLAVYLPLCIPVFIFLHLLYLSLISLLYLSLSPLSINTTPSPQPFQNKY